MNFWIYILLCENKNLEKKRKRTTYYVGSTSNLERRLGEHKNGKSWYTSKKKVKLVYCETQPTRKAAYKREFEVKRFTRKEKEGLINTFNPIPESYVINI
ncbi:MAG: GIY-YIG nuclease family protein [Candidatus Hodarchaeales archaeon]|jgi:putative endonuclease